MKTVLLTFSNDFDAEEFVNRLNDNRQLMSTYQAELIGLTAGASDSSKIVPLKEPITDILDLTQTLLKIRNLCDAPHWTADRRYQIRALAQDAITKFVDNNPEMGTMIHQ